ncbi:hypothetical protein F511_06177 [Dorcoceras hygrometricum]|uniref:Uncharacterized protein n=1 Tax=Dorcoceras hygrometricum TaxID=472368 RepID=A0A2Z7CKX0_9LAMI|nr:hypothetical protein F511_06177 [Dorcoceras hygrometricum]
MNQIEMGLRFPIPRFIAAFCRHIQLSPSQLASNSYSFLLALAVLLSYRDIPLIPYVLMQLVQVKRLGPGKFYLSHKGDHSFIKGNPSSHKGWMSRFFYIKCDVMRDPWRCEMHWRDSAITIVPRTPDRAPSLTPSSRLYDLMGKAELVKAMQEAIVASPKKTNKKRKAPSTAEKEARGEKRKKAGASTSGVRTEEASKQKRASTPPTSLSEEALDVPPVTATTGAPSSGKEPEQPPPFDPSKDSLVESPCPVAATRYICNMAPDRDVRVLRKARNADVVGDFSSNLEVVYRGVGGQMVKRLTKAHQKSERLRDQFDKAMSQHAEVLVRLEELETLKEHPASFFNVQQAIAEMADEEEVQEEEEDEDEDGEEGGDGADATPPSSPFS